MPQVSVSASRAMKLVGPDEGLLSPSGRETRGPEVPSDPSLFSPNAARRTIRATPGASSEWFVGSIGDVVVPESLVRDERLRMVFPVCVPAESVVSGAFVNFQYHLAKTDSGDGELASGDVDPVVVPIEARVVSFGWSGTDSEQGLQDPVVPTSGPTSTASLKVSRAVPDDSGPGEEGGSLGTATYTGSSDTNDMVVSGSYFGSLEKTFVVKVSSSGVPDMFVWSDDGGQTFSATAVPMSSSPVQLGSGVAVRWDTTTGHTVGSSWSFPATPAESVGTGSAKRAEVMSGTFDAQSTRVRTSDGGLRYVTYLTGIRVSERTSRAQELEERVRAILAVREGSHVGVPTGNWRFVSRNGLLYVERAFLAGATYRAQTSTNRKTTYHRTSADLVPYVVNSGGGLLANAVDGDGFGRVVSEGERYTGWGAVRYGGRSLDESVVAAYFRVPGTSRQPSAGTPGVRDQNRYVTVGSGDIVRTNLAFNWPTRIVVYYPGVSPQGGLVVVSWRYDAQRYTAVQLVYNPFAISTATDTGGTPNAQEDDSYHHWAEARAFVPFAEEARFARSFVPGAAAFGAVVLDVLPGVCSSTGKTTNRLKTRVRSIDLVTEVSR